MKKQKKLIYTTNIVLIFIVGFLLSIILYLLYHTYLNQKIILLNTIISNPNLQAIKTNGSHLPTEEQIKTILKQKFPALKINKIQIKNNITATTATITSNDFKIYRGSVTLNYLLDKSVLNQINLNQQYVPNQTWMQQRGYNGLWISKNPATDLEKNLTNAFLSHAEYPNLPFYEKPEFNSYEELLNFLNPKTKSSLTNFINNYCPTYINKLKQLMVRFYNYMASSWGKNNVHNVLKWIDIAQVLDADGYGHFDHHIQIHARTLQCYYNAMGNHSFYTGYSSVLDPFRVFFHELGHMLDHFLKDNMHISISNKLKDFLTSKIINFNNWPSLDKEKIFKLFHLSSYSFSSLYEVIGEGFVYWFLIPNELKTRAWEFWHEFLTLYLPKSN